MSAAGPVLEVTSLRVEFKSRGQRTVAVDDLSYSVHPGETVAVIGESGSGKTVSSRAIMGLLPRSATATGSVCLDGREILNLPEPELRRYLGPGMAMVFQDPARSLNPTMRVGTQVMEAVLLHEAIGRKAAQARVLELLEMVQLPTPGQQFFHYPHQLSGGMRQRVVIAIALACRPKVLFADEATSSLDVTTQARIMELLLQLRDEIGTAIVLISHNLALAATFSDEVVVLYAGRVVERAKTDTLFRNVKMPYAKLLLDAVPRLDRPAHSIVTLPDRSAQAPAADQGCAFARRCPRARQRCLEEVPPLHEHEPDHEFACWYPYGNGGPP